MAEKRARRPPALLWLTLIVLAALLLAPQTGWLVREQLGMQVRATTGFQAARAAARWDGRYPWEEPAPARALLRSAAERHPDDLPLQIAAALKVPPDGEDVEDVTGGPAQRLRALAERFTPTPELYAAALIPAAAERLHLRQRDAGAEGRDWTPVDPSLLAAFDRDAAEGERLDPDNAYFPVMRAIGYFAVERDEEALAALQRAAEKPRWDDYITDRLLADARLQRLAYGDLGALMDASAVATSMAPHHHSLPRAARLAVQLAIEAEQAGRPADGLAIRHAVARVGARWRADAPGLLGAGLGARVVSLAAWQPGGEQLPYYDELSPEMRPLAVREAYVVYLREAGRAEEARWYQAETEAGDRVNAVRRAAGRRALIGGNHLSALLGRWFLGFLVLASVLVSLLLAGVGACLARAHSPLGAGLGLAAALLALAFLVWRAPWLDALAPAVLALPQLHIGQGWLSLSKLAAGAAVLVYPLVALGVSAGVSLYRGDGRFHARLASSAGWTGLALLLLYALVLVGALRHEAAVQAGFERMLVHEGHYLADLAGMEWPE